MPDIGAIASKLTQLNIVAMVPATRFEHENQLMLTAVKGTHAGGVFDPNTDIFQLPLNLTKGREQFVHVAPIHANELNCTFAL